MRKALFPPVIALITLTVLVATAGCGTGATQASPLRFGGPRTDAALHATPPGKRSLVQWPTRPISFEEESRVGGAGRNTPIGVTTLHGPKSGFTGKVWVWAPPEYYEKRNANKGFPVMEALPGSYGFPSNYWTGPDLKLEESLAQWSRNGSSLPFIVVMPVLNPDDQQYYDGSDIPGQPKMGTWLSEDVPDLVRQNFRTLRARDAWAVMGSSSGGFAALKNVLQHPDTFKVAIPNGPDIVPDSPLWNGHAEEKRENNPEVLARRLIARGGPPVHLAFQDGSQEHTVLPKVRKFIDRYGHGPVHTRLQIVPGGTHSAATYVRGLGEGTMRWVSARMQGPTA
ncbi:esterase family protein [Streptomyces decoyicus]|uniref:Esterase family protein n=1 Tax=Streptomyces decoyicus TaxID=249567 RepID=A0ABZ1FM28_9ACTN|nr:alpha/beta hydrolase-fold protein [Streptomyces decoyicus]WSB71216.1 esterase family protein [Streptomyces decoyicus]